MDCNVPGPPVHHQLPELAQTHVHQVSDAIQPSRQWTTEDEMVGWHHQLGHKFEQALAVGDGQGSLACCSPRGRKESDTTEQLK